MVVEQGAKLPLREGIARQEIRHAAYAKPGNGGAAQRLHIVAGQHRARPQIGFVSGKREWPSLYLAAVGIAKADPEMPVEVARTLWRAVPFKIGGRGAEQHLEWAQGPRHQA